MSKMNRTQKTSHSLFKFTLIFIGLLIALYFLTAFIFTPKLSRYPDLASCFTTSVHKILLCSNNKNYTQLDHISKYFIHSTLISEDDSFYLHKGIDWNEFKKSFKQNLKVKRFARGGSTITQQLVKNAYLTQSKSIFRKIREIFLAQQVEEKYSKAVILEKYLNVIELGIDIYGVKQASLKYFGKSPSQLNLLESVYLTTLLPNPKVYSQSIYKGQLPLWQSQRIETLLYRLLKRKRISEDLYNLAKDNISHFPWKGLDLNETKEIEDDNLDFLDNLNENYSPSDSHSYDNNSNLSDDKDMYNEEGASEIETEQDSDSSENIEDSSQNFNTNRNSTQPFHDENTETFDQGQATSDDETLETEE